MADIENRNIEGDKFWTVLHGAKTVRCLGQQMTVRMIPSLVVVILKTVQHLHPRASPFPPLPPPPKRQKGEGPKRKRENNQ